MALGNPFAGIQQADIAFLEHDGIAYRCVVWQRDTEVSEGEGRRYRGASVDATIYVEQAHGSAVVMWSGTIRTPGAGNYVDCPRIVPRGQTFAVHWIEYDPLEAVEGTASGRTLHRSTFDVESDPYAWDYQGSIGTSYYHLYDVQGFAAADEYVLAHASDTDQISVYRVNGDEWIDTEWVSTSAGLVMTENVLAVSANRTAPCVIYQRTTALAAFSFAWADGSVEEGVTSITGALPDPVAVGVCGRDNDSDGDIFVVVEHVDTATLLGGVTLDLPSTVHFELDVAALGVATVETTPNTTLQSKPWSYVSARSVSSSFPQMFAVLGYQDAQVDREWQQSNHYVARYERGGANGDGRPMLVANLVVGIADARRHGEAPPPSTGISGVQGTGGVPRKRRNHLPSPSRAPDAGPLSKSTTTVLGRWSRIDTAQVPSAGQDGVLVAGAAAECVRYHHDDAWAYPYSDNDPPLPTVPYASVGVPQLESVPSGSGLFLSGGTPQTYDGRRFVEAGFPWYPEIIDITEDVGAGALPAGVYQYTAVYEWRDGRGQTHRSEPCPPYQITSAETGAMEIAIRCCGLSMKDNDALGNVENAVKIDVYRTEVEGAIFYPLYRGNDDTTTDLVDIPKNDPTALLVSIQDSATDVSIASSIPLPFNQLSGAWSPLPGETVPALRAVASWQNRVIGVSSEEPKRLWISREILSEPRGEQYTVPEFSADLTFRIDEVRGAVVALQEMDSALVLFTREAIYALHGTPADALGQGSTLQLQLLQRDTGCVEPRSVAPAPDGIYFQSRRGLYKLTRQNSLEFVGADVEDTITSGGNVRAVTVHEDSHQVRVLCNGAARDSPLVLVYDWLLQMWATWRLPNTTTTAGLNSTVDALAWRGHTGEHTHVVLQAGGVQIQKTSTHVSRYADEAGATEVVAIPVDIQTGWIHLAGLAGFKRVREVGLHLTKPAAGDLTITLEYDLDGLQTDAANIQTEIVTATVDGYIPIRTAIQKCMAIRIRIAEGVAPPTGTALLASTLNIHAITLTIARKPGTGRVSPTTQRT